MNIVRNLIVAVLMGIVTTLILGVACGSRTLALLHQGWKDAAEESRAAAEREITQHGFQAVVREARFIDRPQDEDLWWLMVFRKP